MKVDCRQTKHYAVSVLAQKRSTAILRLQLKQYSK